MTLPASPRYRCRDHGKASKITTGRVRESERLHRIAGAQQLMTRAEIDGFIAALPREVTPNDGRDLAKELSRSGKLTRLQLQAVYQGKSRNLVLGKYVILDRLGRGGMGQVYKARQRTMNRVVAIKVLPPLVAKSQEAVRRFHREMTTLGRLSHPNIVTAYDADVENGVHFLAMEYVEGKDLAALVKERGPLSVAMAVDCIRQAARGLALCPRAGRCASGYQACQPAVESQRHVTSPRPGSSARRGACERTTIRRTKASRKRAR